jgi:hypothetical protein
MVTDTPQSAGKALNNCLRAMFESSQISRGIMGIAFFLTAKEVRADTLDSIGAFYFNDE